MTMHLRYADDMTTGSSVSNLCNENLSRLAFYGQDNQYNASYKTTVFPLLMRTIDNLFKTTMSYLSFIFLCVIGLCGAYDWVNVCLCIYLYICLSLSISPCLSLSHNCFFSTHFCSLGQLPRASI